MKTKGTQNGKGKRGKAANKGGNGSHSETDPTANTGVVKFFNGSKGYGFIAMDAGGKDKFVHISAVEDSGYNTLDQGQHVIVLEQKDEEKGPAVTRLEIIDKGERTARARVQRSADVDATQPTA